MAKKLLLPKVSYRKLGVVLLGSGYYGIITDVVGTDIFRIVVVDEEGEGNFKLRPVCMQIDASEIRRDGGGIDSDVEKNRNTVTKKMKAALETPGYRGAAFDLAKKLKAA